MEVTGPDDLSGSPSARYSVIPPSSGAGLPVDGDDPEREHAGRADQQVQQGGEVAPDHAEDPFPPNGAGRHEGQDQHGQQEVGQGQAEDELVAEGEEVGLLVQGDHDDQVAQADKNGDDDDGDEVGDDGAPFATLLVREVAQLLPVAEGGVEAHGQGASACGGQSMPDDWKKKGRPADGERLVRSHPLHLTQEPQTPQGPRQSRDSWPGFPPQAPRKRPVFYNPLCV